MRPRTLFSLALVTLVSVSLGCKIVPAAEGEGQHGAKTEAPKKMFSGPTRDVSITVQDYKFLPDEIVAKP
ncbi:MAG: hypothetical protein QOJ65_2371, partial [Fimbriimonadaceae bacterium]|nr:hypothetical protein [Fimbriimonadaceae bacterium]